MTIDYEELARTVEATVGPLDQTPEGVAPMDEPKATLAPHEVATQGPVIVDTRTGIIREADSGHILVQPVEEKPERELDISLATYALIPVAAVLAAAGALVAPLAPSQKLVLLALDALFLAERVLWEIRRSGPPTAPEGVIYGSEQEVNLAGYDDGRSDRSDRSSR